MQNDYWNFAIETMDRESLRELQLRLLLDQVRYVYDNSPFYQRRFDEAGVKPRDIRTFEDFREKIPVFRKDEVRAEMKRTGDPFGGLLCCPSSQLKNIWISRGTSGYNTFGGFTANDLETMTELICRSLWMVGVRPGMRVFLTNVNWHYITALLVSVCERMRVLPIGFDVSHPVGLPRVASQIRWLKPEVLLTSHMMITSLPKEVRTKGYEPQEVFSSIKIIVNMGEPLTPMQKRWCEGQWGEGVSIFDLGGTGESYALFVECSENKGGHYWEDLAFIECIDPETKKLVEPGERGEQIVTNLQAKGLVYLRYGVEDVLEVNEDFCNCGRTHSRARILGRTIWLTDVKGKKVMPIEVQRIFEEFPETAQAAFTILKRSDSMEKLEIRASYDEDLTLDPPRLKVSIEDRMREMLGIESSIEWVHYEKLPTQYAKIMRITDLSKGQ